MGRSKERQASRQARCVATVQHKYSCEHTGGNNTSLQQHPNQAMLGDIQRYHAILDNIGHCLTVWEQLHISCRWNTYLTPNPPFGPVNFSRPLLSNSFTVCVHIPHPAGSGLYELETTISSMLHKAPNPTLSGSLLEPAVVGVWRLGTCSVEVWLSALSN